MEFLNSQDELKEKAIKRKMEELYNDWFNSYASESGDEFDSYVEEELLGYLHPMITQMAKSYYSKEQDDSLQLNA